jgi:DNA polymerase-3 subunit delta
MPEIHYKSLKKYLNDLIAVPEKQLAPVYLIFGEELLVKTAFDDLLEIMLPGAARNANYDPVEGAVENIYELVERVNTYSLLGGARVVAMRESQIFYAQQDKSRLLEKAKRAYDDDDLLKAAKYFLGLLGNLNLSFDDVDKSSRQKALNLDPELSRSDEWLDDIIGYCLEKNLRIPEPADETAALQRAIEKGFPKNNHLLITTDIVDKRRSLYKAIKDRGVVIDCAVPKGDRRADKMAQEDVLLQKMTEILKPNNKQMDQSAYMALMDMTGFDLRTFCGSLEKLIDYVGERNTISVTDVESVLKRTKKDPIYDLTNAIAERHIEKALLRLNSLLQSEFHPLQILAAIINQVRKLLLAKDFTKSTRAKGWSADISFNVFQQNVIPSVVAYDQSLLKLLEEWENSNLNSAEGDTVSKKVKKKKKGKIDTDLLLARNPKNAYPVFQLLKKSERYSMAELTAAIGDLNEIDMRLKTTGQNPKLALERLIFRICSPRNKSRSSGHQS